MFPCQLNIFIAISTALLSTACVDNSVHTRLASHSSDQKKLIHRLSSDLETEIEQPIKWHEAVKRIECFNLTYKNSLEQINQANKSIKKIWWSLSPDFFTFANITKNIAEITDLDRESLSFSVVGNLNIPNPFFFHAQLYGNRLNILRTRWQHEVTRRNLHAQLYQAYVSSAALKKAQLDLNQKKRFLYTLSTFGL